MVINTRFADKKAGSEMFGAVIKTHCVYDGICCVQRAGGEGIFGEVGSLTHSGWNEGRS